MNTTEIQKKMVQIGLDAYDQGVNDAFNIIVDSLHEIFPDIPQIAQVINKIPRPAATLDEVSE